MNDKEETVMGVLVSQWLGIGDCIMRCRAVKDILVYGSRAKGTYRRFSDIDITLKGEDLQHTDLFTIYNQIDDLNLPYEIDLSIMDEIDNPAVVDEINRYSVSLKEILSKYEKVSDI